MHADIAAVLAERGVICPRHYPHLANRIEYAVATGRLATVLRGAYAEPTFASSAEARVAAATALFPNATFVRETAAHLTWWPELRLETVQVAGPRPIRSKGFRFERRTIDAELRTWDGARFVTCPALTVLDLTDSLGGAAIDEALRRRATSLPELWNALALTRDRPGNGERARLLRESRDLPWSELERRAHVLLRSVHAKGWVTNHEVVAGGRRYYLDAAFPHVKLDLEFDGWAYHRSHESFIADRARDVDLTLAGWTVLRFTASTLDTLPGVLRSVLPRLESRH